MGDFTFVDTMHIIFILSMGFQNAQSHAQRLHILTSGSISDGGMTIDVALQLSL